MYAVDTCVFVNFLRGRNPHTFGSFLASDPSLFRVPAVVRAELMRGAEKARDPQKERMRVQLLLAPFEVLPFDGACADQFAVVSAQLEQKGIAIGRMDLLIAATCLANGAILVTDNLREFKRVPGLRVEHWEDYENA